MGLAQEMQKDNLAQQLNKSSLSLAKGIFSMPAGVPQLGGGYGTDPTSIIPGYKQPNTSTSDTNTTSNSWHTSFGVSHSYPHKES